ncbi:hypothetical protein [Acidibrevibacterium fodinaquatile]|jgi:predicted nucleic acid-binding protein|uniref:hypothetical protein n=1 Tax=Acidibrevibacterium fodinaquatile TaxID=1969806 RepID=UPI0013B38665|nr:hypothetical protein [Acidibrevibacterium fodinaquatile]
MRSVLVDTGIWYAIFDPRDGKLKPESADCVFARINKHRIILPWPVLYETLGTKFVKNETALKSFKKILPTVVFHPDESYRHKALELSFESSLKNKPRHLSLVDCVLRLILDDKDVKVSYFVTVNPGDFADVCRKNNIELWNLT